MSDSLSPSQLDELDRLIHALHEKCITPEERARLEDWICRDAEARRVYVRYMNLYAGLRWRMAQESEFGESQPTGKTPSPQTGTSSFLGDVFCSGANFLSQSFVLTLLVAIGLPGLILTILFVSVAHQPVPTAVAAITQSHQCTWGENSSDFAVGRDLFSGQEVQVEEGFAEVTFADGATVLVEGPATFRPGGRGQGFLQAGRVVANVPKGAEGFTIATPSATIVDLGTEFGVEANRKLGGVVVEVLKGKVEIGLVDHSTEPREKRVLSQGESVLARGGQYLAAPAISFVRKCPSNDALEITPEYVAAVKQSGPVAYWRFETRQGDQTPNEVGPDNAGQLIGPVSLGGWDRNHTLSLPAVEADRCMVVDPVVGGPAGGDYSVEFWMRPESDREGRVFGVAPRSWGRQDSGGVVVIKIGSIDYRDTDWSVKRVRFWQGDSKSIRVNQSKSIKANKPGGSEIHSEPLSRPRDWHHVVAVNDRESLKLYVDGHFVGTATRRAPPPVFRRIILGQWMFLDDLKAAGGGGKECNEYFVGQLDEMAIYNRALSLEDVSRHYDLAKPNR